MSIWDIVQQVQIENLKARQVSAESSAESAEGGARLRQERTDGRIDQLVLITEAMWELLSSRFGLTVADLAAQVREIDLRDGRADGKLGPRAESTLLRCPSCQAVVPAGRSTCQFCGADVPEAKTDPFRI
jgi:hypothetical protein